MSLFFVACHEEDKDDPNTLKILAIGNSFSEDAITENLSELFAADGTPSVIANLYYGGCSLEMHWTFVKEKGSPYSYTKINKKGKVVKNNYSLAKALADEKWDFISLQQSSSCSGISSTYQPFLDSLVKFIDKSIAKKADLIWHQTWAYAKDCEMESFSYYKRNQDVMYNKIISCSKIVNEKERISLVVPCGTAIQNGRGTSLGDTFNRDGYHLETTYGRYLAACTWFEAISGHSVEGISFHPKSIDDNTAAICQWAAHHACLFPFEITKWDCN